jgi:hypothetical protein
MKRFLERVTRYLRGLFFAGAILVAGMQYDLVFMPSDMGRDIVELKGAVIRECGNDMLILTHGADKYVWKNRSGLFKNNIALGNYFFLHFQQSHEDFFPADNELF